METTKSLTKLTPDITLSHLVSVDPESAQMLASIGLDPAEHEGETLRAVCKQRQWSEEEVLQWLKKHRFAGEEIASKADPFQEPDFGTDIVGWCEYIEEHSHISVRELLNEISRNFPRVVQIHGTQYPRLKNMKWHFEYFEDALRLYLRFEQKKFFSLIRKWQESKREVLDGTIRELNRCITIIRDDQKRLQDTMSTLRDKGNEFENPSGACTTLRIMNQNFKMLFKNLEAQFSIEREKVLPMIEQKIRERNE